MTDIPTRPTINVDKVCHIALKAKQFDAKEAAVEEQYGANPSDEGFREVLDETSDDPVFDELREFIGALHVDERAELVALAWIGRGDHERDGWREAVALARREHGDDTGRYLLGLPLLGDYLEEGLAAFDLSCADFESRNFQE
jgi:hypothetical protein